MIVPESHEQCPNEIRDRMAAMGVEIVITTAPPLVVGPYPPHGYTCPHGTTYWIEPTGEQIAQWHRDGTP